MSRRTNLATNPSVEVALTNYFTNASSSLAQAATASPSGTTAVKITKSAQGAAVLGFGVKWGGAGAISIPAVVGQSYTSSIWVRAESGTVVFTPVHWWYRSDNTGNGVVAGTAVTVGTSWTRISISGVAPAGTTQLAFSFETASLAAGSSVYGDALLIEQSATLGDYFDGSSVNSGYSYAWSGTAHESTSTEILNVPRTNLMPYPSAEVGSSVWNSLGGSNAVSTDFAYVGTKSVKLTKNTTSGAFQNAFGALPVDGVPRADAILISPNTSYTFSYYAYSPHAGITSRARIYWQTNTGFITVADNGATTSVMQNGWSRHSVTATSPANATKMSVDAFFNASANMVIYIDGVLVEQSLYLDPYFDGDTTDTVDINYAWSGAAHASTSTASTSGGTPNVEITSALTGAGTLSSNLKLSQKITSTLSGSGTLTSALKLPMKITSAFTGTGTLEAQLNGFQKIRTALSGEGQLSSTNDGLRPEHPVITSRFTGEGSLLTTLKRRVKIVSDFSAEGVLITDLSYADRPEDRTFLGKLSSYTVTGSATPLNPAGGSNALPTMSAVFADAIDPEYAMGTELELESTRIGKHRGEVVSVSTADASDRSSLSVESPLTMLNSERRVYPVIVPASTWFSARAVDYWTQQCGLFYDRVPGEAIAYASGFGHGLAYLKDHEDKRFYEDKSAPTQVVNNRSVRSFINGSATIRPLLDEANMMFALGHRLVFSVGVGVVGTGRTGTTAWQFHDEFGTYIVSLSATSAGAVTAKLSQPNGKLVTTHTATVTPGSAYRLTLSIEKYTKSSLGTTFTVDSDNLAGTGSRVFTGSRNIVDFAMPRTATLDSITYTGATGSGAEMYWYGSYLTTALTHPASLPEVTKVLSQTNRAHSFTPGFAGNMWDMLNEYAAINRLDVSFVNNQLVVGPRNKGVTYGAKLSGMNRRASRRDKYQKVALLNQNSTASLNKDNLLWRADSVYQVNTGEVFETTIQTEHSILELSQPKCVTGITPFPYESGTGQYVVTGADGYICSPRFWREQGGKVEVELTDKEGEFLVRITGPDRHHETRAPYRISEGAGDRPALYVSGSGIINKPEQHEINTGARNAKEGYDSVFESPFLTGIEAVYDTASEMAREYSASNAEFSFNEPKEHGVPSEFGQNPSGARLEHECGILRISRADVSASTLSANAVPQTTIADYKASLPAGSKIRDEKAKYRGMTIRQQNIKPLKGR